MRETKNRNMIAKEEYSTNGYTQYINATILEPKSVIDQYHANFTNAKDLTLKLARDLDGEGLFEKSQICRRIKEILEDKIKEGKVSEKWIEECLPQDYKRKYSKSEVSSLSKSNKNRRKIDGDNFGEAVPTEVFLDREKSNNDCSVPSKDNAMVSESELRNLRGSDNNNARGCTRCQELEEALVKASPATPAICASKAEVSFVVPKEIYQELLGAILCDYDSCYVTFDRFSGLLLRVEVPEGQSDDGK